MPAPLEVGELPQSAVPEEMHEAGALPLGSSPGILTPC